MGTPEENPIQLIEKIVLKDRAAFERFYDRYAALVFSLALRILRIPSDAEELTQDVFYQIWRQVESYKIGRGAPEAWLITIARSRAIDKLRSTQRRNKVIQPLDDFKSLEALTSSKAGAEEKSDAKLSLEGLLGVLSGIQREALELAYFEGLTQSEIAVKLDLPLGTVKTRIRDGLKQLRESLNQKEKLRTL